MTSDHAFQGGLKGSHREMGYAGALSFLRRRYSKTVEGADLVVSGIPWDCAVTNRPGARLGPRAIRAASTEIAQLDSFPWGIDPFKELAIVDFGDAWLDPHHPETIPTAIEAHATAILRAGPKMLTFGGDHFVSLPLLRAHANKHGPLALIQIDAHSDTWDDDGRSFDHGSMFSRALEEGIVDPRRSIQLGIRTHNATDAGFEILTAPWIHRNGIDAAMIAVRERVSGPAYLTFDIDALDPAFAPGTGTPVPGGLASWQALEMMRGLRGLDLVGMDLVEVAPAYDHAEITAIAAAQIAYEFVCLLALANGADPAPTGRV